MNKNVIILFILSVSKLISAQTNPIITRWLQNTTGITGRHYVSGNSTPIVDATVAANVQIVKYSTSSVYINTNCIPAYITGPFLDGNPSLATSQAAIFKFPLNPTQNTGVPTATTGGNIGLFINGVALFDYRDGVSWKNSTSALCGVPIMPACTGDGVWNRDAVVAERVGFDCSKAHPAMGNYHHHQNPSAFKLDLNVISTVCNLYNSDALYVIDSTQHSPLIGFAYDGFPIYGAYGYKNADATGGIVRMKSSYALRNISVRTHYADGTDVTDGPAVSTTYPLGYFREDYQYNATSAATPDYLDSHNGRFCVTPEYPGGIYCYFATVNANWNSAYPYVVGPTFYGNKTAVKVTSISEAVSTYPSSTAPSIYIAAYARTICSGTSVSFTSSIINGGISPSYQWKINGTSVGTNSNSFASSTLLNNDIVTCVLTTASFGSATSNAITMTVNGSVTPSVSVSASSSTICSGTNVTFTASQSNGGGSPTYQWKKNGSNVGTNNPVYSDNTLLDGDAISCVLTSNGSCLTTSTANSNSITMTCPQSVTLNLKVFIQGFYNSENQLMNPALFNCGISNIATDVDTLVAELHAETSPYNIVEGTKGILKVDGTCPLTFSALRMGNSYYLAVKHRNSIETWSASPVLIDQTTTYDFSTDQSKAYGNNLVKVPDQNIWAIYSGDISHSHGNIGQQDGLIDSGDFSTMENAVSSVLTGYIFQDITGNGIVESGDYSIIENNVSLPVIAMHP